MDEKIMSLGQLIEYFLEYKKSHPEIGLNDLIESLKNNDYLKETFLKIEQQHEEHSKSIDEIGQSEDDGMYEMSQNSISSNVYKTEDSKLDSIKQGNAISPNNYPTASLVGASFSLDQNDSEKDDWFENFKLTEDYLNMTPIEKTNLEKAVRIYQRQYLKYVLGENFGIQYSTKSTEQGKARVMNLVQ